MLPEISPATADALRTALQRAGYRTDGVRALLGREAHAALGRGEPEPRVPGHRGRRRARGAGAAAAARRGRARRAPSRAALAPLAPADAAAAGLLRRADDGWAAALDLRPYGDDGADERAATGGCSPTSTPRRQERDHVTGVGARVADARRGDRRARPCGTAARPRHRLRGAGAARDPARPDRHRHRRRAAGAGHGPGDVRAQRARRRAAGRAVARTRGRAAVRPDRVQPAVRARARPRVDYVYRDSGQAGDDALAALVARAARRTSSPAASRSCSASWLHVRGEDWPDRVRSWLPDGVDAWVVQREVTDPALHVGTWQRDAGLDLASPAARAQAGRVARLAGGAAGRGRRVRVPHAASHADGTRRRVVVRGPARRARRPAGPGGRGLAGPGRLAARARRATTRCSAPGCGLADGVVLERYARAGRRGLDTRPAPRWPAPDGPRWRHEVDEPAAALLAGCRGALPLGELVELLAFAHDRPVGRAGRRRAAGGARAGPARPAGAGERP